MDGRPLPGVVHSRGSSLPGGEVHFRQVPEVLRQDPEQLVHVHLAKLKQRRPEHSIRLGRLGAVHPFQGRFGRSLISGFRSNMTMNGAKPLAD